MRLLTRALLVVALLAGPVAAATEAVVKVSRINLRAAPDAGSHVLAVLDKGTRVTVLVRENGWIKVHYLDRIGYLRDRTRYIRVEADTTTQADALTRIKDTGRQIIRSDADVRGLIAQGKDYAGVIYPLRNVSLSMGVGGVVSSLAVKVGDAVHHGQLLLQLDDAAEVIETQRRKVIYDNSAALQNLAEQVSRTKSLMDDVRLLYEENGSVSREEVLRAELEFFTLKGRQDQLQVDKARERLEYLAAKQDCELRRLYAPISGFITLLEIDAGEWVRPGQVLMQVVDTSEGILRLAVPESVARLLKTGSRVPIRFEAYPEHSRAAGQVTFVSAAADPASSRVQVEITFDNRKLGIRPGGKGYVLLPSMRSRQ